MKLEKLIEGLKSANISVIKASALLQIERKPLKMTQLATALQVSSASITGICDQLEKHRLVTRESVKGDRRAFQLAITDEGRALLAYLRKPTTPMNSTNTETPVTENETLDTEEEYNESEQGVDEPYIEEE